MKIIEIISWIAHRLAMAFACITVGFVLAFWVLTQNIEQVAAENQLLRSMVKQCSNGDIVL